MSHRLSSLAGLPARDGHADGRASCARTSPRPRSPTIRPSSRNIRLRVATYEAEASVLLGGGRGETACAQCETPRSRADQPRRLRADPAARLYGSAAASRPSCTGRSRHPSGQRFPSSPISSRTRPSNSASCRTGRRAISISSAPMRKPRSQAGLTRDQIVGVYAFETGGNGTYDSQAGLVPYRERARAPISPAVGYNQLLSTNTVSLLAEDGNRYLLALRQQGEGADRPCEDSDGAQDRGPQTHDRLQPHGPEPLERARPPGQDHAGRHLASTPLCWISISARCCRCRSCTNSVRFARIKGYARAADRRRARTDEPHRRRQRLRHGDDAAGIARARTHCKFLPAAKATSAIRSRAAPAWWPISSPTSKARWRAVRRRKARAIWRRRFKNANASWTRLALISGDLFDQVDHTAPQLRVFDIREGLGQCEPIGAGQEFGDVVGNRGLRRAVLALLAGPETPSKKKETGTFRIWEMCCSRLAPIRLVPFSYFWTCWKVSPSLSPSFS